MKRVLAAASFAALFLVTLATGAMAEASAQYGAPHLASTPLTFRTHAKAFGPGVDGFSGADLLGGYSDSIYAKRVGAQIAVLCTTTAVPTLGWALPVANQALSDTSGWQFAVHLSDYNGSGCESGADSAMVCVQASVDGINWFSSHTFKTGAATSVTNRLDQTNVNGIFTGALSQNGAALATGPPAWTWVYKVRAVSQWDAGGGPDVGSNLLRYPYLRFIFGFLDAKGYMVRGSVTHTTTKE